MQPNTKLYIYLKHDEIFFFVITCCNVFNVWPRDAKRLDTPALGGSDENKVERMATSPGSCGSVD